jgi:hypothetical protein
LRYRGFSLLLRQFPKTACCQWRPMKVTVRLYSSDELVSVKGCDTNGWKIGQEITSWNIYAAQYVSRPSQLFG